jgi:hypothetical protein
MSAPDQPGTGGSGPVTDPRRISRLQVRTWHLWFGGMVVAILAMLFLYYGAPRRNIGPAQPIPFSHRVHAGVKAIDCRFCHPFVERSENAGLPEMEKCYYCHEYIIPLHPEIRKEKQFYQTGTPVPWVQVFYVPDFVKFWHLPHIRWAKLDCVECHGDVRAMDRLKPVDFQMEFCVGCHQKLNAQLDCWLACHH